MSEAERAQLLDFRHRYPSLTWRQLGRLFNLHPTSARLLCQGGPYELEQSVAARRDRKRQMIREGVEMVLSGASYADVAAHFDRAIATVLDWRLASRAGKRLSRPRRVA